MPVDFTSGPTDSATGGAVGEPTSNEGSMFAPVPSWDRRKRRGGQRQKFFTEQPADTAMTGAAAGAATGAMASDTAFTGTPAYAERPAVRTTTTTQRRGNGAAVAIGAGLIVLAGVAAAGWYATQPHDNGVAQLTPGGPGATAEATAESAPATGPALAQNTAPAPPAPPEAAQAARPHARIAAAAPMPVRHRTSVRSVEDEGVNASATVAAPVRAPAPRATAPAPAPTPAAPSATTAAPSAVNPANPPAENAPATQPSTPPQSTTPTPPPADQPPPQ